GCFPHTFIPLPTYPNLRNTHSTHLPRSQKPTQQQPCSPPPWLTAAVACFAQSLTAVVTQSLTSPLSLTVLTSLALLSLPSLSSPFVSSICSLRSFLPLSSSHWFVKWWKNKNND
ncbi:hypothetical protein S245_000312, partial [Arachis hypogaea]